MTRPGPSPLACCLLVVLVLVGCADSSESGENRRFANDPVTEVPTSEDETTSAPLPPATEAGVPTATSPNAALSLLQADAAADGFVFQLGDTAQVIDPQQPGTGSSVRFAEGYSVLDLVSSASGGRIAALLQNKDGNYRVELRNRRGEQLAVWDLANWSTSSATSATPEPGDGAGAGNAITWTGVTERLLVTLGGRHLITIPLDSEPSRIDLPEGFDDRLITAQWSPVEDRIAIHGLDGEGGGTIWTISPFIDGTSWRQVVPPPADAANLGSVTRFAWVPDGSGLLYILAQDATEANPGGNLYRINLQSRERQVIATPGRGGPAAQIVDLIVSPDSETVAYVIAFPVDDEWHYHSLWLRSLSSALYLEVETGLVDDVSGMGWAGNGFGWQTSGRDGHELSFADARSGPAVIWNAGMASPAATPVASPVAATPMRGSPAAVPAGATTLTVASPAATPIASPVT